MIDTSVPNVFDSMADEELHSRIHELQSELSEARTELQKRKKAMAQVALDNLKEAQDAYVAAVGTPSNSLYYGRFSL